MNITGLITAKVVNLPPDHQAEVLRYVLALIGEPPYPEPHNPERTAVTKRYGVYNPAANIMCEVMQPIWHKTLRTGLQIPSGFV